MMVNDEVLKELKKFNDNVSWLKIQRRKDEANKRWITAQEYTKATGLTREQLRYRRLKGEVEFKQEGRIFRYNLNNIQPIKNRAEDAAH